MSRQSAADLWSAWREDQAEAHHSRKRIVEEHVNYSNGNSFSFADGNSMCLGGGDSTGPQPRDGSRPASAAWMFTVLVWRI